MSNGWTGGQYSLLRVVFGVWLLVELLILAPWAPGLLSSAGMLPRADASPLLHVVPNLLGVADAPWVTVVLVGSAAIASCLLVIGFLDRAAALWIWYVLACIVGRNPLVASPGLALAGWMLLAHAALPRAPIGSVAALRRDDPGGGWRFPGLILAAARIVLVAFWVHAVTIGEPAVLVESAGAVVALLVVHLLAFDPAWIPPRRSDTRDTLFYDGGCGLCHGSVRFLLAEDTRGAIRFAPLGGPTFEESVDEQTRQELPDSVVLLTGDGRLMTRFRATRRLLVRLGGLWRAVSVVLAVVPPWIGDALYDAVARRRLRWFRRPADWCPLIPAPLRDRFAP